MILDNVKELMLAQEIINEADLASYDLKRTKVKTTLSDTLYKKETVFDHLKKHEVLFIFIFLLLLEMALAFQCVLCAKVADINEPFLIGCCLLEMFILFIIGKRRISKERKLELEVYQRALEKQEVLKNLDCFNQERKEYISYLNELLEQIIQNYKNM